MEIRRPLEWHCKQMDHFVGLNFSANFNFALVGHLLKGNAAVRLRVRPVTSVSVKLLPQAGPVRGSSLSPSCLQATDTRPPPPWPEP